MKRRDFSLQLAGAGLGLAVAGAARAQGAPVEGQQYTRLQTAVPLALPSPQKKIEVVEFFWYGCPHCFALEPVIEPWSKKVAPDVYFHQMPFAMIGQPEHQKLFYALEELGQREALHRKVFEAIHVHNKRLNNEADITAFVVANGVDGAKFNAAFKSFSVDSKLRNGRKMAEAYKVDSVPMLGIQGRYTTSAAMTGTHERSLTVVDFLIQRARQAA